MNIREALTKTLKPIVVETQGNDGNWYDRDFANEAAAREYELKWDRQGVPHRRKA